MRPEFSRRYRSGFLLCQLRLQMGAAGLGEGLPESQLLPQLWQPERESNRVSAPSSIVSVNGTFEDVIAFFRISERTGRRWLKERPPRLAYWRQGRNQVFGEDAVVELKAESYVTSRRMAPGEAREIARREWREHLHVRQSAPITGDLAELRARVERLEKLVEGRVAA
jgi:hypothetical protein